MYLPTPVLQHGMIYMAFCRCKNPNNLKIFVQEIEEKINNEYSIYKYRISSTYRLAIISMLFGLRNFFKGIRCNAQVMADPAVPNRRPEATRRA